MKVYRILLAATALAVLAAAQSSYRTPMGYDPAAFSQWFIRVDGQSVTAGSQTIQVPVATVAISGGPSFNPLATDVPVRVNDGSLSETITPSAVACTAGVCSVTAVFVHAHPGSYTLGSADDGLQEAVNWCDSHGGGIVVVGPDFAGSASAESALTGGNTNTLIADTRSGSFQWFTWRGSDYGQMWAISGTSVLIGGNNIATLGCSGVSAPMVGGSVTVNAGCITGSRPISLTEAAKGGTQGTLSYTEASGQIVITSSSSTDTSTVAWVQN